MDTAEIQARLDAMPAAMSAKGLRRPECDWRLRGNENPIGWVRFYETDRSIYADASQYFHGETAADIFDQMDVWITNLPSPDERRMAEFTDALATVIELGRANGIDVAFVNPLTETMKKLSENALTYQPQAAE